MKRASETKIGKFKEAKFKPVCNCWCVSLRICSHRNNSRALYPYPWVLESIQKQPELEGSNWYTTVENKHKKNGEAHIWVLMHSYKAHLESCMVLLICPISSLVFYKTNIFSLYAMKCDFFILGFRVEGILLNPGSIWTLQKQRWSYSLKARNMYRANLS